MSNKFVEVETPELEVLVLKRAPTVKEMKQDGFCVGTHYFARVSDDSKVRLYHLQDEWFPKVEKVTRASIGKIANGFQDKKINSLVWSLAKYVVE